MLGFILFQLVGARSCATRNMEIQRRLFLHLGTPLCLLLSQRKYDCKCTSKIIGAANSKASRCHFPVSIGYLLPILPHESRHFLWSYPKMNLFSKPERILPQWDCAYSPELDSPRVGSSCPKPEDLQCYRDRNSSSDLSLWLLRAPTKRTKPTTLTHIVNSRSCSSTRGCGSWFKALKGSQVP